MMKDILSKLAELEATAPKVTKKKMLKEDSTTAPINVSNKPASLKDVFAALSENVAPGQKPLPVLDPQKKQAGMGFVTSNNPSIQNILKNLDPKDVQIMQAPGQAPAAGQQPQATAAGQPNPNQVPSGQLAVKEVDMGQAEKGTRKSTSHIKGYKVVDSSGKVISKHRGQRDAIQAALKNDEYSVKAIKDKKLDELSPELMTRYARGRRDQLSNVAQAHDMRTTGQTNPKTSITKDKISGYYDAQAGDIGKARVAVGQQPTDAAGQAKSARMSQDLDSQAAFNAQRKHKALKGHDALVKTVGKLRDTGAIKEGAKVDRMVKHIEKSEKKLGKSKGEAEDIAWATANKRGMLDNKNKKAVKEGFYSVRSNQLKQELEKNGWERISAREVPDHAKYGYRKNGVGRFYKVIDEPYHSFDVSFVKPRRVIDKLVPLDTLLELIRGSSVTEGDIAPTNGIDTRGAGLGAGRNPKFTEGKEPQVEVIDNAFNRENYKDLIGKKYPKSKAPSYARVKEVTEGKKGVNPFPKKDDNASTKAPAKGKKPDFLDLDKDGNKKEPMKKAAADKKMSKQVNEIFGLSAKEKAAKDGAARHAEAGKLITNIVSNVSRGKGSGELEQFLKLANAEQYQSLLGQLSQNGFSTMVHQLGPYAKTPYGSFTILTSDGSRWASFKSFLEAVSAAVQNNRTNNITADPKASNPTTNKLVFNIGDSGWKLIAQFDTNHTLSEGKKPDFLDLDKDGNKKEPMKKAAADKKKKKVDESMNHRISAARFEGKAHGLKGHAHCGKAYEDLGEMKAYHEGYKEGLDECYGQGVYETAPAMPAATVPGMASAAMPTMEDEMEEGNAFTAALAKTPKGGKFSVGGKTFTDRSNYGENVNEYAFESWDNQLNDLLNEGAEVNEGLSVSISKGQQNSPDSVTITAQDQEAEHLLAFVKNAGLGLFGDDNADTQSSAMSVQPSHGAPDEVGAGGIDIGVVDGHDGMMGLMQKLSGIQAGGAEDYADEEGEEHLYGNHDTADKKDCGCDGDCECSDYDQPSNEETCDECGSMMEAGHSCNEEQSEDQMEFEVSEANAPDSETAEHNADEEAEAEEDMALAKSDQQDKTTTVNEGGDGGEASEEGPENKEGETDEEGETVSESFANLFRKLSFIAEESTEKEDDKAEKAGKKVAKDIEHDEGHKGKDDDKAEKAGKKVTKDIEYDDKKDKKEKVDEWANNAGPGKTVSDTTFEQDIDFMTKVIAGGLNKPKSTGQTTIPVIAGQDDRMHDNPMDWATLAGIKK